METPTEVDRCLLLERHDPSLWALKLGISSYSTAQPTLTALRKSPHLRDLFITSSIADPEVGRLCNEILVQNSSLERLTLDLRECSDEGVQYLSDLMQSSRNLKWLSLMLNNVTEKGAQKLADALGESKLLGFSIYATQLDLHDCCIGDAGAMHFAAVLKLGGCGSLTSICIAQNAVGNTGLESILEALAVNSTVSALDLHSNRINKAGATKVAAFLTRNATLKRLILDENHEIGSEGTRDIALALCQNSSLEALSLKSCSVGKKGAERFATVLSQNETLRELNLCGNVDIGDDAVELISRGLRNNSSLLKLDLSSCGIGDEGCSSLADVLRENSTLTHLALHKNEIGNGGALALSETLAKSMSLTSLVLTENRFGEKGTVSLIQSLQHNSTLTVLNIGPEKISSSQLKGGHCSIGDKSTAVDIVLAKNKELRYCKKLIRELQQKNEALTCERDALQEELHIRRINPL